MHATRCLALALAAPLAAQTVQPPFDLLYSIRTIGGIPGLTGTYGAITFARWDANKLLCSNWNALGVQNLFAVDVVRNAQGHVTGFAGTATRIAQAERIDGGLDYGPGGVLFFTRYDNSVGQLEPGSTTADRVDFVLAPTTVGGLAIVPAGFPGAGRLKTLRWPGGQWVDATLLPDGNGTYSINGELQTAVLSNGPDGFVYVPAAAPLFTGPSVLVAEYSGGSIATYTVDAQGDPMVATRQPFVTGIAGAFALTVDPVTQDVLHVNWNTSTIDVIEGFGLACGPCSHYGTAHPGTGNVEPMLECRGCALAGQGTGVQVARGPANAFGVLAVGFTQLAIPLFGGTLLHEASFGFVHLLDGNGSHRFDLPVPAGMGGVTLLFQAGYLDAGAVGGVSMTDGIVMPIR